MVVPNLLPSSVCANLIEGLPQLEGSGTRELLEQQRYQQLSAALRSDPSLLFALEGLAAVQAILFNKTADHNWSLQMHSDSVFPIEGEGSWQSAGDKEGLPYVRVPREEVSRFVAVRVCLDDVGEGDLTLEPGSHWPNSSAKATPTNVVVPQGGVLVLNPTLRHGSSKLDASPARRVVHIVYAPPSLPDSYSWVSAI